jgi:hypothetical protein
VIYKIENSMTGSDEFFGYKDEYLCCHFRSAERAITKDRVRLEVSGLPAGVKLVARKGEGLWQVNARLPKPLSTGLHQVQIRTLGSPFSAAVPVKRV